LTRCNPPTFDVIISEGRNAFSFPSSISSKTQNLIVQMMKVNRNERPQSVKELLQSPSSCEETIIEKPKSYVGNNIIENARETKYKRESAEIEEKSSPYWASFACPFVFMACWFFYLYSDRPDLGVIILSLFVGLPISFLISRFLYNSIKKSRIEKWKMEHPNDPRNKFLHFYKDV
jgi:serine/threonine protein kinase